MAKKKALVSEKRIEESILLIRGQKVILDKDLAVLYDVETRILNQAVTRNIKRFPGDFMFRLTRQELRDLRARIVTSSWGGSRYLPRAFTEQGVAMLSSVLNSERAIQVNIEIIRAFVRLRQILSTHLELASKLEELEKKYDKRFRIIFDAIRQLMAQPTPKRRRIGFETEHAKK